MFFFFCVFFLFFVIFHSFYFSCASHGQRPRGEAGRLKIQKTFKTLAANPEVKSGGKREFVLAWSKFAMTDSEINVLGADDIEVAKEGNEVIITANYTVKVPLFKNISLMFDFAPTSAAK